MRIKCFNCVYCWVPTGNGAGGWKFRAHVSGSDGLVLDESSFEGRVFNKAMSVPYLEGTWTDDTSRNPRLRHEERLELTSDPSLVNTVKIRGRAIVGSTLVGLECVGPGSGDIFARATYAVNDFVYGGKAPSYLKVTQEYRFRGIDAAHPCEPSEKLSCARFWPSLKYSYGGPRSCVGQSGRPVRCGRMFAGIRMVQRMEFRPDGRPQILDNSTQDADFGIVRNEDKDFERDPAVLNGGWRTLIDRKGSTESQLRGHTPVVFWEMNSTAGADAAFPILPDYKHGGNGAIFFGG